MFIILALLPLIAYLLYKYFSPCPPDPEKDVKTEHNPVQNRIFLNLLIQ